MKKLTAFIVTILMVLALLPATALADSSVYYVGETAISATENADGNSWSWHAASKTLRLVGDVTIASGKPNAVMLPSGATVFAAGDSSVNGAVASDGALTLDGFGALYIAPTTGNAIASGAISVAGSFSGTIAAKGGANSHGIYAKNADITINANTGTITAAGGDGNANICGMFADNVTIHGGTVNVCGSQSTNGNSHGIYATGKITISGGNVNVSAGVSNSNTYGLCAPDVEISGGRVNTVGGSTTDGTKSAGIGYDSNGIHSSNGNKITITDGEVFAAGGDSRNHSAGLYTAFGDITISGSSTKVTAVGCSEKPLNDGGVERHGIWAHFGNISIYGGAAVSAVGGSGWDSSGILVENSGYKLTVGKTGDTAQTLVTAAGGRAYSGQQSPLSAGVRLNRAGGAEVTGKGILIAQGGEATKTTQYTGRTVWSAGINGDNADVNVSGDGLLVAVAQYCENGTSQITRALTGVNITGSPLLAGSANGQYAVYGSSTTYPAANIKGTKQSTSAATTLTNQIIHNSAAEALEITGTNMALTVEGLNVLIGKETVLSAKTDLSVNGTGTLIAVGFVGAATATETAAIDASGHGIAQSGATVIALGTPTTGRNSYGVYANTFTQTAGKLIAVGRTAEYESAGVAVNQMDTSSGAELVGIGCEAATSSGVRLDAAETTKYSSILNGNAVCAATSGSENSVGLHGGFTQNKIADIQIGGKVTAAGGGVNRVTQYSLGVKAQKFTLSAGGELAAFGGGVYGDYKSSAGVGSSKCETHGDLAAFGIDNGIYGSPQTKATDGRTAALGTVAFNSYGDVAADDSKLFIAGETSGKVMAWTPMPANCAITVTTEDTTVSPATLNTMNYTDYDTAWNAAKAANKATVTLYADFKNASDAAIDLGDNITLDLNGRCIDTTSNSKRVFNVAGALTLKDAKQTGYITGSGSNGGGVYIAAGGSFTMNGGKIKDCKAEYSGGGVFIFEGGSFTMNGGEISGCKANIGRGGGVYSAGTMTLSGTSRITGNTHDDAKNNVLLADGAKIELTGALVPNALIGIANTSAEGSALDIAKGNGAYSPTEDDAAKFSCDTDGYFIFLHDNTVKLSKKYTVTLNTNGGTIDSGDITSYYGGVATTLPTDVTKDGYRFRGWYENANFTGTPVTKILPGDFGDKSFYAKWVENSLIYFTITARANNDEYGTVTGGGKCIYISRQKLTAVPNPGYHFVRWTENDMPVGTDAELSIIVSRDREFIAEFEPDKYALSVINGEGSAEYSTGETVTVTANAPADGTVFDKWVINYGAVTLEDENSAQTSFTMPAEPVELLATYRPVQPEKYALTVTGGNGGGEYAAGEIVTIQATQPNNGTVFEKWTVVRGAAVLENEYAIETSFTMPAEPVELLAVFKGIAPPQTELTGINTDVTDALLSWKPVGNVSYQLVRRHCGTTEWETLANDLKETSFADTGLDAGEWYVYYVRAVNHGTPAKYSNRLLLRARPAAPTELTAVRTTKGIQLKWSDPNATAVMFRVTRYDSVTKEWKGIRLTGATTMTDTTAKSGVQYSYRVHAYYELGSTNVFSYFSDRADVK